MRLKKCCCSCTVTVSDHRRLDRYRPKENPRANDFTFEAHIYFDDAFVHVERSDEVHLNKYAKNLVEIITAVYR